MRKNIKSILKYGYLQKKREIMKSSLLVNQNRVNGAVVDQRPHETNPYMERAVMTGITKVGKESIFSDLNNLTIVTTAAEKYRDCFGSTETEVFHALDMAGLGDQKSCFVSAYDKALCLEVNNNTII